jgi:hypothetical protein
MAQQRWRAVTIAIALGAASPAAADALQYQAPEAPDGCPDELAFRQALRRELPASATDDRGGARFVATVETDGAAWTATLVVETDGRGTIVARLVDTTCEAAVTRLAAATVLAVRAAPAPEPKRPTPIDPDRVRAVRIGVAGGYGRNAIANGLVFDLDATYGDDARLGGWLRIAGSSRDLSSNTSETATEAAIGVGACFHRRFLEICLRAGGGMLHLNRTSFASPVTSTRAYIDVAGRLGVLVPVHPGFALRLAVEGGVVSHHQSDAITRIDPAVSRLRGTIGFVFTR